MEKYLSSTNSILLFIEMNNIIHTVQSESSGVKLTRFQIELYGWNWSERHLLIVCINQIVPGFVVYYLILCGKSRGETLQIRRGKKIQISLRK